MSKEQNKRRNKEKFSLFCLLKSQRRIHPLFSCEPGLKLPSRDCAKQSQREWIFFPRVFSTPSTFCKLRHWHSWTRGLQDDVNSPNESCYTFMSTSAQTIQSFQQNWSVLEVIKQVWNQQEGAGFTGGGSRSRGEMPCQRPKNSMFYIWEGITPDPSTIFSSLFNNIILPISPHPSPQKKQ